MNTTTPQSLQGNTPKTRQALITLLLGVLIGAQTTGAALADDFQHRALFNPTASQRQAESRGRVMIYDGLDDATVERAVDEQFERMEHMMFVRIRHTEPDGEASYDDDGCD